MVTGTPQDVEDLLRSIKDDQSYCLWEDARREAWERKD